MKYGFIDSMRGIAILMVIMVHTSQSLALPEGLLKYISAYGQMGVQLFFVASAYTLFLTFEKRRSENNSIVNFYIRRFFRIAPLYYIGILGYFVFNILLGYMKNGQFNIPYQYTFENIIANILFVHGLYEPAYNNIVPGGWSIGTEMLFYLVFPLLMVVSTKFHKSINFTLVFPILVVVGSTIFISLLEYPVRNNGFIYCSILNQSPVFAVGITLYLLHTYHTNILTSVKTILLPLLIIGFSYLSMYLGWIKEVNWAFVVIPFISAISFMFLVELFKRIDKLNIRILMSIGQRSYSMYIIHFVFAHQLSRLINSKILVDRIGMDAAFITTYTMTVFATFLLAGVSSNYIEKHFIALGRRVIDTTSPRI